MTRFPQIAEAARYCSEPPIAKTDIYLNGSPINSTFRTLSLAKEFTVPTGDYTRAGILPELGLAWRPDGRTLLLHSYDTGATESLGPFASPVLFVKAFAPLPGIFSAQVALCLAVFTDAEAILYAHNGAALVNTDYSTRLRAPPRCVAEHGGRLFVGCEDGRAYQLVYQSVPMLGYRYMRCVASGSLFQAVAGLWRQRPAVTAIAASAQHLVVLAHTVAVYSVPRGLVRIAEFPLDGDYASVAIHSDAPLLFSCQNVYGARVFYTPAGLLLRREGAPADSAVAPPAPLIVSDATRTVRILPGTTSRLTLTSFNTYQLRNFSRHTAVENTEHAAVYAPVCAAGLSADRLVVLTDRKVMLYDILDARRFLASCNPAEVAEMYRCYGDIEFMVCYYALLAAGEDVSRMEAFCQNDNIRQHALFIYIYQVIAPVYATDLCAGARADAQDAATDGPGAHTDPELRLDAAVTRLKVLRAHIPPHFTEAREFIDEFLQARYYLGLLRSYGVPCAATLEALVAGTGSVREESLKALLAAVALGSGADPLLRAMRSRCPRFLPYDEVNVQRGTALLQQGGPANLEQALACFLEARFDRTAVQRFNKLGYFYGSVALIRAHFDFSYEDAAGLLRDAVRCRRAMEHALQDAREAFLYPLFEALVALERFEPCCCCADQETEVNLLGITNPLFEVFLRDASMREAGPASPRVYTLYWKYLLVRRRAAEAADALLALCARHDIAFEEKLALLERARTVAAAGGAATKALSARALRMQRLAAVQRALAAREPAAASAQLLMADELYNDYCYRHPDLALRVLDIIGHGERQTLREVCGRYLKKTSVAEALAFFSTLSFRDPSAFLDILAARPDATASLCTQLEQAGFDRRDIVRAGRAALLAEGPPGPKETLLRALNAYATPEELSDAKAKARELFGVVLGK